MIYLASPYASPNALLRSRRFICAREFVWHQMQLGVDLISPIVYGHQFARDFEAPIDHIAWQSFNEDLYTACNEVWVLQLSGWQESLGVQTEIFWAERDSKLIQYKGPLPHATV